MLSIDTHATWFVTIKNLVTVSMLNTFHNDDEQNFDIGLS